MRILKRDGARFRRELAELDMSQVGFARLLEVDVVTVNRWAHARRRIRPMVWMILDGLKRERKSKTKKRAT